MVGFDGANCQTDPSPKIYVPTCYCFSSAHPQCSYLFLTAPTKNSVINLSLPARKFHLISSFLIFDKNKKIKASLKKNLNKKQLLDIQTKPYFLCRDGLCYFMAPGWFPTHLTVCLHLWYVRNFKLASTLKHWNVLIFKPKTISFGRHQFVHDRIMGATKENKTSRALNQCVLTTCH